jgi:ATP-dependent Clp protease ATP-binding subunit ClpC
MVLVDVAGEGEDAHFTFTGTTKGEMPDLPPVETAESGSSE